MESAKIKQKQKVLKSLLPPNFLNEFAANCKLIKKKEGDAPSPSSPTSTRSSIFLWVIQLKCLPQCLWQPTWAPAPKWKMFSQEAKQQSLNRSRSAQGWDRTALSEIVPHFLSLCEEKEVGPSWKLPSISFTSRLLLDETQHARHAGNYLSPDDFLAFKYFSRKF